MPDEEEGEEDYEAFLTGLQRLLPPEEALILQEAGHEKMNYLVGDVYVITADTRTYISMRETGIQEARRILQNPSYETRMDY